MLGKDLNISMIAALGSRTRAIGNGPKLLWEIQEDLKRFSKITRGHPVIMGRKTWDSLPEEFKPLPKRTNIVVSRRGQGLEVPGMSVVPSVESALSLAAQSPGSEEIFIIGGGEIYKAALHLTHRAYLTLVDDEPEADVFFPEYEETFPRETFREEHTIPGEFTYRFVIRER